MAESDDIREEMRNAITIALTLAAAAQQGVVRSRERSRRDALTRLSATHAEARTLGALERARQSAAPEREAQHDDADQPTRSTEPRWMQIAGAEGFAAIEDPRWWDIAAAQDIAAAWQSASEAAGSDDPELADAGRQAQATMGDELRERYDVDPNQIQDTVTQQLNDAVVDAELSDSQQTTDLDQAPAHTDEQSLLQDAALRSVGDAALLEATERHTPGEAVSARQDRRALLEGSDAPEDAIDGALAVEDAFPHRTDQVRPAEQHSSGAERSAPRQVHRSNTRRRG